MHQRRPFIVRCFDIASGRNEPPYNVEVFILEALSLFEKILSCPQVSEFPYDDIVFKAKEEGHE
jgi:hypothetical protein